MAAEPDLAPLLSGRAVAIVSCFRYAETLASPDLVYFPAQYARELAEHCPVLWVNPPGRRPRPPRRAGRVRVVDTVGRQARIGVWHGLPLLQARLALAAFARAQRARGLLLLAFSSVLPAGTGPAGRRVAFMGDDFFPVEHPFVRECDLVVCSSQLHAERVRAAPGLPPALQLSMGVTPRFLERAQAARPDAVLRRLFPHPERPLAAYFGTLARADVALLAGFAHLRPHVNLLLAGTLDGRIPDELRQENVAVVARYRNEDMPGLLAGVDVGLIAYAENEFNAGSSPTKLFEYLALGLPVVSTDLGYPPDLVPYVRLGSTPAAFAAAVDAALAEPGDVDARRDLAARSTPRHRLAELLRELERRPSTSG